MVVNDTHSVFLMSVVPVTFGPIWPWFRTAPITISSRTGTGPRFADPWCRALRQITHSQLVTTWRKDCITDAGDICGIALYPCGHLVMWKQTGCDAKVWQLKTLLFFLTDSDSDFENEDSEDEWSD